MRVYILEATIADRVQVVDRLRPKFIRCYQPNLRNTSFCFRFSSSPATGRPGISHKGDRVNLTVDRSIDMRYVARKPEIVAGGKLDRRFGRSCLESARDHE
jgi:hypothetical protein